MRKFLLFLALTTSFLKNAQTLSWQWAKALGGTALVNPASPASEAFVVMYNESGIPIWANSPLGGGSDIGTAIGSTNVLVITQ